MELGFFSAGYCDKSERFQALGCFPNAVAAAEIKASEYAVQVPWLDSDALPWRNPKKELCPFSLHITKAETCAKEEGNLESVVLGKLNSTTVRSRMLNMEFPVGRIPKLFSVSKTYLDAEIVAPIQNSGFGLITSDGLETASNWDFFSPLLQPLSTAFWIAVAISSVVVTFVMVGLRWSSMNHTKFVESFYLVAVVLVDQPQDVPAAAHVELDTESNDTLSAMIKFISALWLFSALLFTNSYKAEFKSNYIFETVYSRNWTSKLLDMTDFQIFLGVEQVEFPPSELYDGHYIPTNVCTERALQWFRIFRSDLRRSCALLERYKSIKTEELRYLPPEIRRKRLAGMKNQFRLVPMTLMKQVIQQHLTAPKTVFVSPLHFFDSDWNYFREVMRLDRNMKFTRRHDAEDTALQSDSFYGFTKGLHSWHKAHVPRRLKVVASSGIWGLGLKWKKLRLKVYASRKENFVYFGYLPLTFSGSDISLVFGYSRFLGSERVLAW